MDRVTSPVNHAAARSDTIKIDGRPARLLIIDDHELLGQSLAVALTAEGVECRVTAGPTRQDVVDAATSQAPDLVLLDLDLGQALGSGLDLIPALREATGNVVMLTGTNDRIRHAECVESGAQGVLVKSLPFDGLLTAIRRALTNGTLLTSAEREDLLALLRQHRSAAHARLAPFEALTPRERDVLAALMDGKSAEDIANEWVVAMSTVRSQIRGVLGKLGVGSQLSAVALARRSGWDQGQAR